MKIAFYNSQILWTTHIGTELELIQRHLDDNDEIISFVCNANLSVCDLNLNGNKNGCAICIKKRNKSYKLLSKRIKEIEISIPHYDFNLINKIMSIDEIKVVKYKEFDVGMAVISSLVTMKRDAYLSVGDNFVIFQKLINNAASLYDFFETQMKSIKPDIVYIFNGRFEYDRALLRVCQKLNLNYRIYDGGYSIDKFMIVENAMLHDITNHHLRVFKTWDESTEPLDVKMEKGKEFYYNKRFGSSKERYFFVRNQKQGLLPDSWNESRLNIPIFLSSEDEFVAIGDQWEMTLYENQLDGLLKITDSLSRCNGLDYRVYIRVHPNSYNTNKLFIDLVNKLESERVEIISPDSPISTYELMSACKKVVSFGSTAGVEATFWGLPSINLGKSFYMNMDVTYTPKSHDEVIDLITHNDLKPGNLLNSIKYGYYFITYGEFYKYYEPHNHCSGTFKGTDIHKYNTPFWTKVKLKLNIMMRNSFLYKLLN
jgi:hypothetical protein